MVYFHNSKVKNNHTKISLVVENIKVIGSGLTALFFGLCYDPECLTWLKNNFNYVYINS